MLVLLRKKNQKNKIFSGNRNLGNNAVNKLVSNIIWKISLQKLWIYSSLAGCVNMSDHRLQHFHVAPVQPYIQIIIIPSSPHIQRKPEFCWVFHQQKQIGRLQSVSLMQSCFSALTCRTLFPWATRNQINKPLTKFQEPFWGQQLFEDY